MDILEHKHFSFILGGRLHDAVFASLIFFFFFQDIHQFLFLKSLFKFFSHIFLHMLNGHILYMSNWIVLYVSCTKVNVTHLSVSFVD